MMKNTVMHGAYAALGLASLAAGQVREVEREVSAEAVSLVFNDPVRDSESVSSMDPGLFEETASASATIPPFASNRSEATQRSFFQPAFRPGEDVIDARGSAVAQLFIQGLGDASATSTFFVRFEVGPGATLEIDEFNLVVDDRLGAEVSRDRPGDAQASLLLSNLDSGEVVFEAVAELDDLGTAVLVESEDPIVLDLMAGRYELRVEASAIDATMGVMEVQDSLAAASYFVCATIVDPGACRADLDGDDELTIFDFLEFQNLFDAGDPAADFDGDGSLTIFDFLAFQNAFDAGCP